MLVLIISILLVTYMVYKKVVELIEHLLLRLQIGI